MTKADRRGGSSRDSIGAVLRHGPFLRLWSIQATTQILQNMINFALLLRVRDVVEVHDLPNANTAISMVILAFSLPAVVFGPLTGVVADRSDKRRLMALLNVGRAVAVLLFIAIRPTWHVGMTLAAYYSVTFLFGVAGQFFAPVEGAMIPAVTPRHLLISANAMFNLTNTAARLIGFAVLGPVLLRLFGVDVLFVVGVVCYLAAAAMVYTLPRIRKTTSHMVRGEAHGVWQEMKDGLVYILQDPQLVRAILYLTLASTVFLLVATLGPEFVTGVLGMKKEDIGYVVAPAGAGIFVGVLIVPAVVRRVGRDWLLPISLVFAGLLMAGMATVRSLLNIVVLGTVNSSLLVVVAASMIAVMGVFNAFILVPSQTMLQERSHEGVRARVYAAFFTLSNTVAFLPIFFAAAAADIFGVNQVLLIVAIGIVAVGLYEIIHARREERAKWERPRLRHRLGPDALPRRKS